MLGGSRGGGVAAWSLALGGGDYGDGVGVGGRADAVGAVKPAAAQAQVRSA